MVEIPRIVVAAPASGQGKTSVATGLLAAFRQSGLTVSPHKVGPDYIDPGYHTLAAGRPGRNLDPFLVGEERIAPMFVHGARTPTLADVAVVEGVMGLFDGMSARGEFASTAHVAKLLDAPVILVVDVGGAARSIAALVHGFATFDPDVHLAGVIANRVGSAMHASLVRDALEPLGIPLLGSIARRESLAVPSRHLGLIPAAERSAAALDVVAELGEVVRSSVDLDAVLRLARSAPPVPDQSWTDTPTTPTLRSTIAVAAGRAFTFGYAEQPEVLRAAGAEVIGFDPLIDERLPEDVTGVIIGGGFPEVHAADLAANVSLRADIARRAAEGMPIAGECAGLLYLGRRLDEHEMCGVLDTEATMTDRLSLGYREATAPGSSVVAAAGTTVHGHEFHRTALVERGGAEAAWQWQNRSGDRVVDGAVRGNVHASYLHLNWSGLPGTAERFVAACRRVVPA